MGRNGKTAKVVGMVYTWNMNSRKGEESVERVVKHVKCDKKKEKGGKAPKVFFAFLTRVVLTCSAQMRRKILSCHPCQLQGHSHKTLFSSLLLADTFI